MRKKDDKPVQPEFDYIERAREYQRQRAKRECTNPIHPNCEHPVPPAFGESESERPWYEQYDLDLKRRHGGNVHALITRIHRRGLRNAIDPQGKLIYFPGHRFGDSYY